LVLSSVPHLATRTPTTRSTRQLVEPPDLWYEDDPIRQRPNDVRLRNVLVDQRSDCTERHVEIAGQAVHSSHGGKRNQRQNQKVFHESLALFVSVQVGERTQNKSHHDFSLLKIFWHGFQRRGTATNRSLQE